MLTVICLLHEAACRLSISYIRQDGVICQLHEAGWRLSVSYMSNHDGYLSATIDSMMVICQLHEAG